jgi:hypothetical protein
LRTIIAASISLTLISCGNTKLVRQLHEASVGKGKAEAGLNFLGQPPDCRTKVPHAAVRLGDEAVTSLKREGKQLDKANNKIIRCAEDRDNSERMLQAK